MQKITVQLLLDVPDDANAIDWVNETLREMQRAWDTESNLIDYAIYTIEEIALNANDYKEGDAF